MQNKIYTLLILLICFGAMHLHAQQDVTVNDIVTGKADVTATNSIRLLPGFHAVAGSNFHAHIDANAVNNTPTMESTAPVAPTTVATASSGKNYVKTIILRQAHNGADIPSGAFKHLEEIQYFDGLGRPEQVIQVGASPLGNNIVQPIVYDSYGREAKKYLPYVASGGGTFVDGAEQKCINYYTSTNIEGKINDSKPFAQTQFENSPLNRVENQVGAGNDWHTKNKKTHIDYLTNTVAIPSWDESGGNTQYLKNSLYITQTTDENGSVSREYKDKLGQVVLKESVNDDETLKTYYIYDDFGLLRTVVPPLATAPADTELCYFYEYDGRKRMISKKIPGADTVRLVYDIRDRLVLTQDGNMRDENSRKFLFTKYDALNRPVMTGILIATKDLDTSDGIRNDFKDYDGTMYEKFEKNQNLNSYGYTTDNSYPSSCNDTTARIIQTVTWYDTYDFTNLSGLGNLKFDNQTSPGSGYADMSDKTKGMATGSLVKTLSVGNSGLSMQNTHLASASYYDNYGNVIKVVSKNHKNGYDVVHSKYESITYQISETIQEHKDNNNSAELTITKNFSYDHAGRLLETLCKVNDQDPIVLNASKYNELGELVTKYLHSKDVSASANKAFVQKVDYTYNIRGWLTSINNPDLTQSTDGDLFGMELHYNTNTGLNKSIVPDTSLQFNGNISSIVYGTAGDNISTSGYGFDYDPINRLKNARYGEGIDLASNHGKFNVTGNDAGIKYDKNGNIENLKRYFKGTSTNDVADDLSYTYQTKSNKLASVTDNSAVGDMADLADYVARGGSYQYDANGNMTYDPSKQGTVKYNFLNLPENVTLATKGKISYHYDAAGNKLAKFVETGESSDDTKTEYIGNLVYTNDKLSFFSTEEGRAIPIKDGDETRWHFEYNLKDHLGNNRVTFGGSNIAGTADIVQTSSYYPFGMVMAQQNYNSGENSYQRNKYLYNGKELQANEFDDGGLDWYDYGARFYDPALGRWHVIDPMAEKYASLSTYDYVGGNPINRFDPNGMDWYMTETDSSYQYVWVDSQDETTDIDGTTYTNQGNTMSLKYGDRYFHYYQNYMVGSSAREINVMDLVLGNQNTTNQLLNSLDGKYANVLFAQAVNHAINTDGTATALTTLAVPASIIGAIEAAPFLLRNSAYLKDFVGWEGGVSEYVNQLIKTGNPLDAAKNFNFTSLLAGKYGKWGSLLSSMFINQSNIQNGVTMQNMDAGVVSRGVSSGFSIYTSGQIGNINKGFGSGYTVLFGIILGNAPNQ